MLRGVGAALPISHWGGTKKLNQLTKSAASISSSVERNAATNCIGGKKCREPARKQRHHLPIFGGRTQQNSNPSRLRRVVALK